MDSKTSQPSPWDVVKSGDYILITKYRSWFPEVVIRKQGQVSKVIQTDLGEGDLRLEDGSYLVRSDGDTFQIITKEQCESEAFRKTMKRFYSGSKD